MPRIEIADLEERLFEYMRMSAKLTGRSIEEVAVDLIEKGMKIDGPGRAAIAEYSRSLTPPGSKRDSTDVIRKLRDGS